MKFEFSLSRLKMMDDMKQIMTVRNLEAGVATGSGAGEAMAFSGEGHPLLGGYF